MDKTIKDASVNIQTSKIKWINAAKLVACIAIILDHTKGTLYLNPMWGWMSCFSVTVFIFLSGITSFYSNERHSDQSKLHNYARRVKSVLIPYAIAVLIYQIQATQSFDLVLYVDHLLHFDIIAPFYFMFVYIQLLFVSPIISSIIVFCREKKYSNLLHFISFCGFLLIAILSIRHTYLMDLYGGGKYLLGGTFLVIYYLGMLFASKKIKFKSIKQEIISLILACIFTSAWFLFLNSNLLTFDLHFLHYFGPGYNPPGVSISIYSFGVLWIMFSFFSLMEDCKVKIINKVLDFMFYLGKYSLYIFLYHFLFFNYLYQINIDGFALRRIIYIPVMIFGSILIKVILDYLKSLLSLLYTKAKKALTSNKSNER